MKLFYDWANDPEARKNSLNRNRISWNFHKSWFKKKIQKKKTIFYVFKKQDVPLGQVRFDKQNKTVSTNFMFMLIPYPESLVFQTWLLSQP